MSARRFGPSSHALVAAAGMVAISAAAVLAGCGKSPLSTLLAAEEPAESAFDDILAAKWDEAASDEADIERALDAFPAAGIDRAEFNADASRLAKSIAA